MMRQSIEKTMLCLLSIILLTRKVILVPWLRHDNHQGHSEPRRCTVPVYSVKKLTEETRK